LKFAWLGSFIAPALPCLFYFLPARAEVTASPLKSTSIDTGRERKSKQEKSNKIRLIIAAWLGGRLLNRGRKTQWLR